jgi:hypothetical protein
MLMLMLMPPLLLLQDNSEAVNKSYDGKNKAIGFLFFVLPILRINHGNAVYLLPHPPCPGMRVWGWAFKRIGSDAVAVDGWRSRCVAGIYGTCIAPPAVTAGPKTPGFVAKKNLVPRVHLGKRQVSGKG